MKVRTRIFMWTAAFLLAAGPGGSQVINLRVLSPENYYTVLQGTQVVFEMTNSGIGNSEVHFVHLPECPTGSAGWCFSHFDAGWWDYPNPTPTYGIYTWHTDDPPYDPLGFPTGGHTMEGRHRFLCSAVVGETNLDSESIYIDLIYTLSVPAVYCPDPNTLPSGTVYNVHWDWTAGSEGYELQESTDYDFGAGTTTTFMMTGISSFSRDFTHTVSAATTYYYRVRAVNTTVGQTSDWSLSGISAPQVHVQAATSVDRAQGPGMPAEYRLDQNFPNPFNPDTNIRFSLSEAGAVKLSVFDRTGREVARLAEGPFDAGTHQVRFRAAALPSGVFFLRIESGGFRASRKMVYLK